MTPPILNEQDFQNKKPIFEIFVNNLIDEEAPQSFKDNWGRQFRYFTLVTGFYRFYMIGKDGRNNIISDLPDNIRNQILDKFHDLFD